MGGGSAEKPKQTAPPPQAQPIDYAALMAQSSKTASKQFRDQIKAQIEAYPQMEELQLGTINRISDNLNNDYTRQADAALGAAAGETIKLTESGDRIGNVASRANAIGMSAEQFAQGRTALDEQIAGEASGAMGQRADQVIGARVADVGRMQASQAGPASIVQGPQGYSPAEIRAQQINAAQAGPVANVQAATTGAPERVAGTRVAGVGPMQSARVGRVQNVRSRDIQASAAEQALMREATGGGLTGQLQAQATRDLALGRSLSAEQSRDAIQSARSGAAARGLSTGNSALAAEMLNRDRFATQREAERRTFAGSVLNQTTGIQQAANQAYMGRQDSNAGRAMQASLANQSVGANRAMQNAQFAQQAGLADNQNAQQRVLTEAGYAQQAGLSNQDFAFRSASQDAQFTQQAALANQQAGLTLGQSNAQLLQQAALANQGAGLQAGQINQAAGTRASEFQQQGGLQASLAHQQTGLQLGLTNAQLQQQANATSYEASQQSAMANAGYAQQAGLANQQANLNAAQYNSSQNLAAQSANQSANYNANYANQNFLQGVSSQNFSQFQGQQVMLSSLYGQQAGIAQNQYSNNLGLAQANVALDPYQRALGSNIPIASQGNAANMIGQSFGNTMTYGSDLYNTNANMQASIYNSYNNNQSALQGAKLQSAASAAAGSDAMTGSVISGAGSAVAGAAAAVCWVARACMPDRWQAFRRSMLRHAPDGFIAAYCQHGPAIAARITTPLRRLLARVTLRSLERAWS